MTDFENVICNLFLKFDSWKEIDICLTDNLQTFYSKDRMCWWIHAQLDKLSWFNDSNVKLEMNSLSLVGLMWSLTFELWLSYQAFE